MSEPGRQPTVAELQTEIEETNKDLKAFQKARDQIRERLREQTDYPVDGRILPTVVNWSGTDAVMGTLDLSIHSLERVIDELTQKLLQTGGRRNSPLKLVIGGADDES